MNTQQFLALQYSGCLEVFTGQLQGIHCLSTHAVSVYEELHGALSLTRSQQQSLCFSSHNIQSRLLESREKIVRSNTEGQFSCHFRYTGGFSPFVYVSVGDLNAEPRVCYLSN